MEEGYLAIEQASELLPAELRITDKVERSLYKTTGGKLIAIANSKLYDDKTFWYSCTIKYFKDQGVNEICFIAGVLGILLIPFERLSEYIKHCGWKKQKKGLSYYVRVKYRDNRFILFCSEYEDIDVTDCFVPYQTN